jgi:hypothetical protein
MINFPLHDFVACCFAVLSSHTGCPAVPEGTSERYRGAEEQQKLLNYVIDVHSNDAGMSKWRIAAWQSCGHTHPHVSSLDEHDRLGWPAVSECCQMR